VLALGWRLSSLAYLRRLPVDEIKIDCSFIKHLTVNQSDAVIVQSVLDWAVTWGFEWPIGRRLDACFGKPQLICVSRSIGIC
jgi:hypothetical protein